MSLLKTVRLGSKYMDLWPDERVLSAVFAEMRVKAMMKLYKNVMPPALALILFWAYYTCGGFEGLYLLYSHPSAGSMYLYMAISSLLIVAMILLLLPIHTLFWFGLRAKQELNQRQKLFYIDLMQKMDKPVVDRPCMIDLVKAINDGLKELKDKEFLDKL